jgi:hypothetical protein
LACLDRPDRVSRVNCKRRRHEDFGSSSSCLPRGEQGESKSRASREQVESKTNRTVTVRNANDSNPECEKTANSFNRTAKVDWCGSVALSGHCEEEGGELITIHLRIVKDSFASQKKCDKDEGEKQFNFKNCPFVGNLSTLLRE